MNMGEKKNKWELFIETHALLWRLQTTDHAEALKTLLFPVLTLALNTMILMP